MSLPLASVAATLPSSPVLYGSYQLPVPITDTTVVNIPVVTHYQLLPILLW